MAIAKKSTAAKTTKKDLSGIKYDVEITKAKEFDNAIAIDMIVNGVKLYGSYYRTYEDRKKPGEETAFISFASRKGNDGKYYQHYWFPIDDELLQEIEKQIEVKLAE